MTDFPAAVLPPRGAISSVGPHSLVGQYGLPAASNAAQNGTWPTANQARFVPVLIPAPCVVYQLSVEVVTQAGNLDLGIYDEQANRLVSSGSTAVAAAGIQLLNITDTILLPGVYYLAMVASSATASFKCSNGHGTQVYRICGVQQQASALPLPNPATFAALTAGSYAPRITAHLIATV